MGTCVQLTVRGAGSSELRRRAPGAEAARRDTSSRPRSAAPLLTIAPPSLSATTTGPGPPAPGRRSRQAARGHLRLPLLVDAPTFRIPLGTQSWGTRWGGGRTPRGNGERAAPSMAARRASTTAKRSAPPPGSPRLQRRPWTDPLPGLFEIHSTGAVVDLWRRDRDPSPIRFRSKDPKIIIGRASLGLSGTPGRAHGRVRGAG
jgi:hypothetical protein